MSKKIILLIVEGITEDISLRGILSEIFNDKKIEFCLVRTDITTREDIKPNRGPVRKMRIYNVKHCFLLYLLNSSYFYTIQN